MSSKTPDTLSFQLKNQFASTNQTIYASVTGYAYNHNNNLFLLQANGSTPYYPTSPGQDHTKITQDVAIPLGPLGTSKTVTIPKLYSARLYFSVGEKLAFYLNKGPALVEPSVSNKSDDNFNTQWGFCELTYNDTELFCNISYVDFIGLPIALDLTTKAGKEQHVKGVNAYGIDTIASAMKAQSKVDGQPWGSLVIANNGKNLRVISPNQGIVMDSSLFVDYYKDYVDSVWQKFKAPNSLLVDTQYTWGVIPGSVDSSTNLFTFDLPSPPGGKWTFAKPNTQNIFNCSNGPFATSNDVKGNISARLAAAFNRTTMLDTNDQPNGVIQAKYYTDKPTSHYSRIVHENNLDHRGYAFPYDDVQATGAPDLSGKVEATDPDVFTVTVGGAQWGTETAQKQDL